jgi:hypothetical protein
VAVSGDGVGDEGVGEEVEELAAGTEASSPSKVEVVIDLALRGLGVAPAAIEALVIGVAGRDLAHVLGPVERVVGVVGRLPDLLGLAAARMRDELLDVGTEHAVVVPANRVPYAFEQGRRGPVVIPTRGRGRCW